MEVKFMRRKRVWQSVSSLQTSSCLVSSKMPSRGVKVLVGNEKKHFPEDGFVESAPFVHSWVDVLVQITCEVTRQQKELVTFISPRI